MLLPAKVAVTKQSPAVDFDNTPLFTEQSVPVATYDGVPATVPPLVARVIDAPYTPVVDVTVRALWFDNPTVTVMVTVPPDT